MNLLNATRMIKKALIREPGVDVSTFTNTRGGRGGSLAGRVLIR
jgi:hypothetical protein